MGGLRHRVFGWACLALVVINVTAALCGSPPGSDVRMPCCLTIADGSTMPSIQPCCASEHRQPADPGGVATSAASAQNAASASTLPLPRLAAPPPDLPLSGDPSGRGAGLPPDIPLLHSVLLI
jgi:hypothetical protein